MVLPECSDRVLECARHTAVQQSLPGYQRLDHGSRRGATPAAGLPVWEASFGQRQADHRASGSTAHSSLWGRYSSDFQPAEAQVAIIPSRSRAQPPGSEAEGRPAGELWLRSGARGPRKHFGPVSIEYKLSGEQGELRWKSILKLGKKEEVPDTAPDCTFTLDGGSTGETLLVVRDAKGDAVVTIAADRCTLLKGMGEGRGLELTGPGIRKVATFAAPVLQFC